MVTDMATMNPAKEPKVEEHFVECCLKIYLMKNDIICSIIIRSYNEEKHIGRLIDGIKTKKNVTGIEIIVVDPGPLTPPFISSIKWGFCNQHQVRGFSFRLLNIGCSAVKGKYLLLSTFIRSTQTGLKKC